LSLSNVSLVLDWENKDCYWTWSTSW